MNFLLEGEPDLLGGIGETPAAHAAPPADQTTESFTLPDFLQGVQLEDDIRSEKMLGNIKSLADLTKGYVHAQRMVGKNKVAIPDEYTTESERQEFWHKMGLPKSLDEYSVNTEGLDFDENFTKAFKEKAYALGMMPNQANEALKFYHEQLESSIKASDEAELAANEAKIGELRNEWGQAFETKINKIKMYIESVADESHLNYLKESGLANNPNFVKFMDSIVSKTMQEGSFEPQKNGMGILSPAEALNKINEIYGNENHPYHKGAGHPEFEQSVKLMERLSEMAYPEQNFE